MSRIYKDKLYLRSLANETIVGPRANDIEANEPTSMRYNAGNIVLNVSFYNQTLVN